MTDPRIRRRWTPPGTVDRSADANAANRDGSDEIAAALEDPEVVEVLLNPDGALWFDRLGAGRSAIRHPISRPPTAERIIRLVAAHVRVEVHAARADRLRGTAGDAASASRACCRRSFARRPSPSANARSA